MLLRLETIGISGAVKRLASWTKPVGRVVLDILLPPRCAACPQEIAEDAGLCPACWATMPFIEHPVCHRFGTPFTHEIGVAALSPRAIAEPPEFDRCRSACLYQGPAKDLVHALKFSRRRELADPMGRWMARAGRELLGEAALLVPVPLHRVRLIKRQFNQSADLARAIARHGGGEYQPEVLRRVKNTRPQVGLTAKQRQKNIRGAFVVPPEQRGLIAGRRVVLVDDVFTTGSTVEACARVLLRQGAVCVDVLTFAVASDWLET
ncbi:ComF family protein [Roseibium sediminis]|uniref:ComF family protein n=1 Tax=Roseibium sediminis TaxID=1775174 RepID=UPI003CC7F71E